MKSIILAVAVVLIQTTSGWTSPAQKQLEPIHSIFKRSTKQMKLENELALCYELENSGRMLYQRFRANKVCNRSLIGKGWTDCTFTAGKTKIMLVGATGVSALEMMQGRSGSGFQLLSVDESVRVRSYINDKLGLILSIEPKDVQNDDTCLYDEAIITLNARVLVLSEYKKIIDETVKLSQKEVTKLLQSTLFRLGFNPGPIDGHMGSKTHTAINQYRESKGIGDDVSEETVHSLIIGNALLHRIEETGDLE
jgi:hypothetical protein